MVYTRILFCDYYGVLSYNKFWSTISNPKHTYYPFHSKIIHYLSIENPHIINEWMIGEYTLEEIHTLLIKQTGIPYDFILKTFRDECKKLDVSEELLRKIITLKDSYYRILATGNMDSFNRYTLPANPLMHEAFDEINNSYDLGILKTTENGKYFSQKCKELGVPIESSILIDDAKENCSIFSKLGGTAYCVTGIENVQAVLDNL